jgi:hypothetical protein
MHNDVVEAVACEKESISAEKDARIADLEALVEDQWDALRVVAVKGLGLPDPRRPGAPKEPPPEWHGLLSEKVAALRQQAEELAAALEPFVCFAKARIEIFGTESRNSFLTASIYGGRASAELTRSHWQALLSVGPAILDVLTARISGEVRRKALKEAAVFIEAKSREEKWSFEPEIAHFADHAADYIRNDWELRALAQQEGK